MDFFGFGKPKIVVEEVREDEDIGLLIEEVNRAAAHFSQKDALHFLISNLHARSGQILRKISDERQNLQLNAYDPFVGWKHAYAGVISKNSAHLRQSVPQKLIEALQRKENLVRNILTMTVSGNFTPTSDHSENNRRLALLLLRLGGIDAYSSSGSRHVAESSYLMLLKDFFAYFEKRVIQSLEEKRVHKELPTDAFVNGLLKSLDAQLAKTHVDERTYLTLQPAHA